MTFNIAEKINSLFNSTVTLPMHRRNLGDVLLEDAATRIPTFKLFRVRNALKNGANASDIFRANKGYPTELEGKSFLEAAIQLKNQPFILYDLAQTIPNYKGTRYAETLTNSALDVPTINVLFRIISSKYADFNLVNENDKTTLTDRLQKSRDAETSPLAQKRLGYIMESVHEHGGRTYSEVQENLEFMRKLSKEILAAKANRKQLESKIK